jgi:hypothetical protein
VDELVSDEHPFALHPRLRSECEFAALVCHSGSLDCQFGLTSAPIVPHQLNQDQPYLRRFANLAMLASPSAHGGPEGAQRREGPRIWRMKGAFQNRTTLAA